jgi:hypothetical protein
MKSKDENYNLWKEFKNLVNEIVDDSDIKKPSTLIRGELLVEFILLSVKIVNKYEKICQNLKKSRDASRKQIDDEKNKRNKYTLEKEKEIELLN